jgi:hypothetical protein
MPFTDTLLTSPNVKSTITQAGLRDRVRGDTGLRGNNLLTDADINAWANEISDEIGQRFRWYRTSATIDSVSGTKEYDFPAGMIALQECHYNQLPMYPLQIADFQRNFAFWRRQGGGTPLWVYVKGNSGFGLHPTPGTSISGGIFLAYEALPPHPANDSDFYTVPYGGERALISGAKLRASEKDSSGEGAKRYEMLVRQHTENMLMLERAIESASEGEATVVGADDTPDKAYFSRWLGFDPFIVVAPP